MSTAVKQQTCEGLQAVGFPDGAPIPEATTLAELRKMSLAEVIKALNPKPERVILRRNGALGPLFMRPMDFPNGSPIGGHTHKHDHVSEVMAGMVNLRAREVDPITNAGFGPTIERVYGAGAYIYIKKNWMHEFTALEPGTWVNCIFVLIDPVTGKPTSEYQGNLEDYS